jgi:alpha-D-xyloside xylohydrolase
MRHGRTDSRPTAPARPRLHGRAQRIGQRAAVIVFAAAAIGGAACKTSGAGSSPVDGGSTDRTGTGGAASPGSGGGSVGGTSPGGAVGSSGGSVGNGGNTSTGTGGTSTSNGGTTGTGGSGGSAGTGVAGSGGAGASTTTPPSIITVGGNMMKIEFCTANIVRVAVATKATFFTRASLATAPKKCEPTAYQTSGTNPVTFTTAKMSVRVDTTTGAVTFLDPSGQVVLSEKTPGGRTMTAATIQGDATFNIRQEWTPAADESLYGLGQHQQGLMNIKDWDLDLHQYNTEVFIPYLTSSRGYGVLWDNTSFTRFGDISDAVPLPGLTNFYATGGTSVPGDVNPGTMGTVNFTGTVTPPTTGDYIFRTYSSGSIQLSVNNQVIVDHWRQGWLPNEDFARVRLTAGQAVPIKLQWKADGDVDIIRLLWKPPVANRTTSLWSKVGDGVDYYYVYGPDMDTVVGGYRTLTGEAPMMPRWAYGFWQCRERYQTGKEITDVLAHYRTLKAPIDNIVQDWRYWRAAEWGSHDFDTTRFPDPAGWLNTIHNTHHAQLMISVWPKFYTGIANYTALNAGGFLYKKTDTKLDFVGYPFTFYDAFNAAGRQLYWSQINQQLFSKGVDAWWMDATEPEVVEGPFTSAAVQIATNETNMHPTALGSGSRMLNAFSLVNSQAVFEGQRAAAPNQRVFILTRNGFAGQQRYAAATWSGDITSTWTAMRKQIPAGLSFSISGMPYWTLDSGGFAVPTTFRTTPPPAEWNELNTRWFEYATFLPIMRVHGQAITTEQGLPREMWEFGGETSESFNAMLKFDKLRYRLLPYIYSLAGAVTRRAGTILRPLAMDFRTDTTARDIGDQYMFGPAFMVSPVTTNLARTRQVYLPTTPGGWYLFWTGAAVAGGAMAQTAAPYDAIPVHVRAGAIVPLGPDLQYAAEKTADPITLYVYAGADGAFTLYEDQGLTYDYQQGAFTEIPLRWIEATKTLTIGARAGTFTGMLASRKFQLVRIGAGRAVGYPSTAAADATVTYTGTAMDVVLN